LDALTRGGPTQTQTGQRGFTIRPLEAEEKRMS
jgi:hypothetical protein